MQLIQQCLRRRERQTYTVKNEHVATNKGKQIKSPKQSTAMKQRLKCLFMPRENGTKSLNNPQLKKELVCVMTFFLAFQRNTERRSSRTLQQVNKRQQNLEYEFRRIYTTLR